MFIYIKWYLANVRVYQSKSTVLEIKTLGISCLCGMYYIFIFANDILAFIQQLEQLSTENNPTLFLTINLKMFESLTTCIYLQPMTKVSDKSVPFFFKDGQMYSHAIYTFSYS